MLLPRGVRLGLSWALALVSTLAWSQDQVVPGAEIQANWVGKELVGTTASGSPVVLRLETNGKASVSAGPNNDVGTWRPHEKGYCTRWEKIRSGQEWCFTVLRAGSAFRIINPDGSAGSTISAIR